MKYAAVLFLAAWLALFFPRKDLKNENKPAKANEKAAYAILGVFAVLLCALQKWELFPVFARWMDDSMMVIYRLTGGGGS
jgi:hypothetical protein